MPCIATMASANSSDMLSKKVRTSSTMGSYPEPAPAVPVDLAYPTALPEPGEASADKGDKGALGQGADRMVVALARKKPSKCATNPSIGHAIRRSDSNGGILVDRRKLG
jgi:hypothetical protein